MEEVDLDGNAKPAREVFPELKDIPFDKDFKQLIDKERPKGPAYAQSLGDKLLFIERCDDITYDIIANLE